MNRRRFIRDTAVAATALAGAAPGRPESADAVSRRDADAAEQAPLVDTHVYFSRWPFRRLSHDEAERLVPRLVRGGVAVAWVGSFDALLHRDLAAANSRLAEECAGGRGLRLLPFGAVNPTLPDWEEDVRRCHEVHRMPGLRLHPDFHGYALDDPRFVRLLEVASRRRLIVQISLGMDDPRSQPLLARVPPVTPEPLVKLLPRLPAARVVLLNYWRSFRPNLGLLARLAALPSVSFDLATVETVGGIETLLAATPGLRLLFGSYAPMYNFGSARGKLDESVLSPAQLAAIRGGHAGALLAAG